MSFTNISLRYSSTILRFETIFWTKKHHIFEVLCSRVWDEMKEFTQNFFCYFLILQEIFNVWFANKSSQSKDNHEYSEKNRKILLHALVQAFGSYFCCDCLGGNLDTLNCTYVYTTVLQDRISWNGILIREIY